MDKNERIHWLSTATTLSRLVHFREDHTFYVTFIRALAAILITNAHLGSVYPVSQMAAGGLLGDVLFFSVAGYSLKPRGKFPGWYVRRLTRIYPSVILVTVAYSALGAYTVAAADWIHWFLFPTNFHFIASILILYVPMYLVRRFIATPAGILRILCLVGAAHVMTYVLFYDNSYYHIDNVREPMIRFLFLEAMLIGALFRVDTGGLRRATDAKHWFLVTALTVGYLVSKVAFSSGVLAASLQLVNQGILLILLFSIMRIAASGEKWLRRMPPAIRTATVFLATITLEVYLVQYVIIDVASGIAPFPISLLFAVAAILLGAVVLNVVANVVSSFLDEGLDLFAGGKRGR